MAFRRSRPNKSGYHFKSGRQDDVELPVGAIRRPIGDPLRPGGEQEMNLDNSRDEYKA
jgi:hypothetical protein